MYYVKGKQDIISLVSDADKHTHDVLAPLGIIPRLDITVEDIQKYYAQKQLNERAEQYGDI